MKKIVRFIFLFISLAAAAQKKQTDLQGISRIEKADSSNYYSSQDLASVKKMDVHTHLMTAQPVAQQALSNNFILISVNTEALDILPAIDSQQHYVLQLHGIFPHPSRFDDTVDRTSNFLRKELKNNWHLYKY